VFPEEVADTALDVDFLPVGTTVSEMQTLPIGADLAITATQPFTAVYNGFFFPGWQVTIDDVLVPVVPDERYGRISFPVPEGRHSVSVRLTETPLRIAADVVSLAVFAALVVLLAACFRSGRPACQGAAMRQESLPWGWCFVGLGLLALVLLLQRVDTPVRRRGLEDGRLPNLDVSSDVAFEGGLTFLGYDVDELALPSGGRLRVDLFWMAREVPSGRYQRALILVDEQGLRWSPKDTLPPRDLRQPPQTWTWPAGTYVEDSQYVETLPGTPPGEYTLKLTLFEHETLHPMRVLNESGQPGAPELILGTVVVTRPRVPVDPDSLQVQTRLNASLGSLVLIGFDQDREEAAPGDPCQVTLFWWAQEEPSYDASVRLDMVGEGDELVASFDLTPVNPPYPTSMWQQGDVWRGRHLLRLPVGLTDGSYCWRLTLLPGGEAVDLPGHLRVTAPSRQFTMPSVTYVTDNVFGDLATLVGFDVDREQVQAGESLTVTLVWRAETETPLSYRVFVHLTGPDGRVVAQSDGVPVTWSRPTTGWLPGEYITDIHTVEVPEGATPGTALLTVGLYDPQLGRILLPNGEDSVSLGEIVIGS